MYCITVNNVTAINANWGAILYPLPGLLGVVVTVPVASVKFVIIR